MKDVLESFRSVHSTLKRKGVKTQMNLCIAVSGTCSLAKAALQSGVRGLIVADRPCKGEEVARQFDCPFELVPRIFGSSFDRLEYTLRFIKTLRKHDRDSVFMMGFNTILHAVMFTKENFLWRITNSHPALLPLFPGHYAVRDTLTAGVTETGCTIHHATEVMDDPRYIIAQEKVPVLSGDNVDTLWERIKVAERALYPKVISAFVPGAAPVAA